MALMALFCFLSLGNLNGILAAPAFRKFSAVSMMNMSKGFGQSHTTSLSTPGAGSLSPLPVIPWVDPHARENQYAFSIAIPYIASPLTLGDQPTTTTTVTVKVEEPTTTTLTPAATTVTEFITVPVSSNAATPPPPMPTPSREGFGPARAIWVAPTKMDDLTPFGVAGGRKNLQIVTEIPAEASAIPADGSNASSAKSDPISMLQLEFPAGSVDPAREPKGGAEFYATPLDISGAHNVTLEYSVFFPADFDWVLAGKLPGLYGGHTGCSGGNAALDCFSTRLMWRKKGAGELYLYAPKDKQTDALCSDPESTCDAAYGLSIGRGSFTWAAGDWTTVRQTVVLNTPGMQDGNFMLDVNGKRVIDRVDVMYRDRLAYNRGDEDDPTTPSPAKETTSAKQAKLTPTPGSAKNDRDPLGPILGGLLRGLGLQDLGRDKSVVSRTSDHALTTSQSGPQPTTATFNQSQPIPTAAASLDTVLSQSSGNAQVGFIGIFFSTFFGGHGDKYATPRDQYIWFKNFALAYNS